MPACFTTLRRSNVYVKSEYKEKYENYVQSYPLYIKFQLSKNSRCNWVSRKAHEYFGI